MDLSEYRKRQARDFFSHLRNATSPVFSHWQDVDNPLPQIGGEPRGVSGYPYEGDNAIQLQMAAKAQGFQNPLWMSFDQFKAAGASVRRGEVGTKIRDWTGGKNGKPFEAILKTVFNADQVEGLALPRTPGFSAEQQAVRQAGLDALIPPRKKTPTPKQYNARLAEVLAERFPDAADEQEQAQTVLRRELAAMTAQARLGLPREVDPTLAATFKPFIDQRQKWRVVESAIDDAYQALKDIGVEALIFDKVPRKEVQPDVAPAAEPKSRTRNKAPVKAKEKELADDIPF